jgi:bifunctional diaminopimelate decarboxylase / aspartate kinase
VLVVVSALSGVTNALQAIADGPTARAASAVAADIAQRHIDFCGRAGVDADAVLAMRFRLAGAGRRPARAGRRSTGRPSCWRRAS